MNDVPIPHKVMRKCLEEEGPWESLEEVGKMLSEGMPWICSRY